MWLTPHYLTQLIQKDERVLHTRFVEVSTSAALPWAVEKLTNSCNALKPRLWAFRAHIVLVQEGRGDKKGPRSKLSYVLFHTLKLGIWLNKPWVKWRVSQHRCRNHFVLTAIQGRLWFPLFKRNWSSEGWSDLSEGSQLTRAGIWTEVRLRRFF